MIVESHAHGLGQETSFEFKYIPQFDTTTLLGEVEASGMAGRVGIEKRNLRTLVIASVVLGVGIWACVRVVKGVVGRLF